MRTTGIETNRHAEIKFPALLNSGVIAREAALRLEPYLHILVERIHPEKIILFGSYAYGQPRPDSDFDLLLVRRDMTTEKQSNMEIRRALREVAGVPPAFTILSKTPEAIHERMAAKSPFYEDIIRKGLELYAA